MTHLFKQVTIQIEVTVSIFTKIKDLFVKDKETRDFEKSNVEIQKLEDEYKKEWKKLAKRFNFDPVEEERKSIETFVKIIKEDLKVKKIKKTR